MFPEQAIENGKIVSRRASYDRKIRLGDLIPHPKVQRKFKPSHAQKIAANLDLDYLGIITVSRRGNVFYVIDGQHRISALKLFGFDLDTLIDCKVFTDMTEAEEARAFLWINTQNIVDALSKFDKGVIATYADETTINDICRNLGLRVGTRNRGDRNSITAVAALHDVYNRIGEDGLAKTLRVIRDSYGGVGLESNVIRGLSLCVQRYDGNLAETTMIKALSNQHGGLHGLINQAAKTQSYIGASIPQCIASTAVDFYNKAHGLKKGRLTTWWKSTADEAIAAGAAV